MVSFLSLGTKKLITIHIKTNKKVKPCAIAVSGHGPL